MENKQKYNKPPLTLDEQVALLKRRGLIVDSEDELRYFLRNVSYYHLSIYFKHYQHDDQFYEGVSFGDVLKIYKFDNKLRFLLLELLERAEKSFKCRVAYDLSVDKNNSHWHLDQELFINKESYSEIIQIVSEEVGKSREISILHYKEKYVEPVLPPIWTSVEILSFGQCIKVCKSLGREAKNKIARSFGEDEKYILSWMYCLSALRNICAHHSRLWNRNLISTPKMDHEIYGVFFNFRSRRLFNHLVVLQIILRKINPTSSWLEKLKGFIIEYNINVSQMGFPKDWEARLNDIMLTK